MMIGPPIGMMGLAARGGGGGVSLSISAAIPADATTPYSVTIAGDATVTDGTYTAASGARLIVSSGVATVDTLGAYAAALATAPPVGVTWTVDTDAGSGVVSASVQGIATLALEWRAADMPAEGTTLVAGDTAIFRLGAEAVPFTVAAGTTVEFPASASGERLVRFPSAMGQIVHADTAAGVRVGLVGTAPGEISAVRWQGGTPVASDAVDISGSASAFFKAAFLTNASSALGRLQDAAATNFDLSLDLSAVSGNVSSFALGGSLMRSPEGAIPFKGVGLETITARVASDGAVTLVVSEANPATIVLADVLDASSFAAMLADAPAASTPPTIDAAALATALGTPAVGAQTAVDLDAVTSGGAAPVSHTSNVGSVS